MVDTVLGDAELAELRRGIEQYLRDHIRDLHAREDLVQETLIRVVRGVGRLRDRRALRGWARRIAFHLAVDRRRGPIEGSGPFVDYWDVVHDSFHPPPDHERDLNERRARWLRALVTALGGLSPRDLALVLGHYFVGRSQAEMADQLGISLANVKVRLYRSRIRLRRGLPPREEYSAFLWARSRYEHRPAPGHKPAPGLRHRA